MKKKVILGILVGLLSLNLVCCSKDSETKNISSEKTVEEKADVKADEYEKIILSSKNKEIISNMILYGHYYIENKDKQSIKEFIRSMVINDKVINFDTIPKGEYTNISIDIDLAKKIVKDGLGVEIEDNLLEVNKYGNVDIMGSDGYKTEAYILNVLGNDSTIEVEAILVGYPGGGGVDTLNEKMTRKYICTFEKNEDSIFGYTLIDVKSRNLLEWKIDNLKASSTLSDGSSISYDCSNLIDNNKDTAWVEGVEGVGEGEFVEFTSDGPQEVSGVFLTNGYYKDMQTYNKNGVATKLKFEFSDGTVVEEEFDLLYHYHLTDNFSDFISFNKVIETDYIKMTIVSAKAGEEYEDTCISEIRFVN